MERLSSGKKINSAADDAAGFAIAERMTAQVRGLQAAVKNVNDGLSYLQTVDGALATSLGLVQRINELSIQEVKWNPFAYRQEQYSVRDQRAYSRGR